MQIHLPTREEPVEYVGTDSLSCLGNAYMHLYSVMHYLDQEGWTFKVKDSYASWEKAHLFQYFPQEGDANGSVDPYDCEIGDKSMIDHRDSGRKYY